MYLPRTKVATLLVKAQVEVVELSRAIARWNKIPRVFLWGLVLGPSHSGGVCSMGPCFVYGTELVCIRVQIRGPY